MFATKTLVLVSRMCQITEFRGVSLPRVLRLGRRTVVLTVNCSVQQSKIIVLVQYGSKHGEQPQAKNGYKQYPLPLVDLDTKYHWYRNRQYEQVRGDVEACLHDAIVVVVRALVIFDGHGPVL
jgi:hypothetical protein